MGRTFLAVDHQDKQTDSLCVIKQLFSDPRTIDSPQKARELFEVEVASLEKLGQHPQIPQLYDFFTQNKHQYLVQEWIDGDNLLQVREKEGIFSAKAIVQMLNNLLPVLAFVHQYQIIHRDIKPENIICRSDGSLVLVDFGAAKIFKDKLQQQTGTVIGSPEYVAPEQLRGKASVSSDIFSLGVTCLYLLTGISPFNLYSDLEDTWVWRDYLGQNSISPELGRILDKMIARATARRYQSTQGILQDLNHLNTEIISTSGLVFPPQEKVIQFANPEAVKLVSIADSELDFTQLQNYLETKNWQQANQETEKLLLQGAAQERRDWFERDDLERLSCENLYIIDMLWREYSAEHFGFSVQHEIWQSLMPKNYRKFGNQVGWNLKGRWILFKHLNFSVSAPRGHLPAISWWFGHAIWGLKSLFLRMDACNAEQTFILQENEPGKVEIFTRNDSQNPAQ